MDGWGGERQIGQKLDDIEVKHVERYKFAQKYCCGKNVLDAACGCGYGSKILSEEAKKVLGVDCSEEAIKYAHDNWGARNIVFRQVDLNTSDLKDLGTFDVIVSLETIEHLTIPLVIAIEKFYDALNSGGTLVLSHPEDERRPGGKFHYHFNIRYEMMNRLIEDMGFELIDTWMQPPRSGFYYHIMVAGKK